jgi:hypothetical protein
MDQVIGDHANAPCKKKKKNKKNKKKIGEARWPVWVVVHCDTAERLSRSIN